MNIDSHNGIVDEGSADALNHKKYKITESKSLSGSTGVPPDASCFFEKASSPDSDAPCLYHLSYILHVFSDHSVYDFSFFFLSHCWVLLFFRSAISAINMKKGGPRTTLFELCKKQQWTMPTFDSTETKSRWNKLRSSRSSTFYNFKVFFLFNVIYIDLTTYLLLPQNTNGTRWRLRKKIRL